MLRALGINQNIVEQLSSLLYEVSMIWAIVVPKKHDIVSLVLELKEVELNFNMEVYI